MKITILSVGKLKEKYWKQAIAEYEKRLGAYSKIEMIEVPDEKAPETMSDKEIEQVKLSKPITYKAGATSEKKLAKEWMKFLKSDKAKKILKEYQFSA